MRLYLFIFALLLYVNVSAQTVVTTSPLYPTETDQITITFDITNANPSGKTSLKNYTGTVYAHTGIYINNDNSSWANVIGTWGNNTTQPSLTKLSTNHFQIVINNARTYYGVTSTSQKITTLNFVLRSSDGTQQTEDIHIALYSAGIAFVFTSPTVSVGFTDPMRSPVFTSAGSTVPISVTAAENSSTIKSTALYVNGVQKATAASGSLSYSFVANNYPTGKNTVKIVAVDVANYKDSTQFVIMKNPTVKNLALPAGNQIGINYGTDPTKVTLAFFAPQKSYVYVIGDFGTTDWKVDTTLFMNCQSVSADSAIWWITIPNLTSGQEYSYQFLVDGNLRIYDPYTEKILDPTDDQYIPATVYPNLKAYPTGKTSGVVGILQTNSTAYSWKTTTFTRPAKEKLVIYELLVRDFVSTHWYKTITDTISYFKKLGVTAIELMPVMEFEGNDSWGYNPRTYFAPDKYYGTKNDLKAFIDACHQNGIAVILDIVLNHAYNSNSMAQLYWDSVNNRPAANNPWFNTASPNTTYSWGNDFNHASKHTKYFVDRVTSFWLTEYKVDGFRFDFSKGFTNTPGDGSAYDASRIAILERMATKIWGVSTGAYVILEHFTANSEEIELANYGMMLWGNLNYNYCQASMGFNTGWNFGDISYKNISWSVPNLVGYMESHDEERVMYKNLNYGNAGTNYYITNLQTALSRVQLAANLFILVPGPKMIWQFGELGYDYSITYNGGNTADKPVRWDYYTDPDRRKLLNTFAALIKLKNNYPAFSSTDFTIDAYLAVKSLYINHATMNVAVFGNFDVSAQNYQTAFQSTGKWYEFFSGDSLTVSGTNPIIALQPGEYRLYTTQRIKKVDSYTGVENVETIPTSYTLSQNYPNPFNPSTTINFSLPKSDMVTIKVYNILGQEVATLVNTEMSAGSHSVKFDAGRLTSGIYIYQLRSGSFVMNKKMMLLK